MRALLWCLGLALAALLAGGCGGGAATAPTAAPAPPATAPLAATSLATAPPSATAGPATFSNPVIRQNFPDPDVLKVGETYYAYATNFLGHNIQSASSDDLVMWSSLDDALPVLPAWSYPGHTWAPEVTLAADGRTFLMYFTARDAASDRQCIGAATSAAPEGPFRPAGDAPLICQTDQGGSIDASSFVDDDGARYLLWKNDGNCCGLDTWLYIQPVSGDGLALEGQPTKLLRQDQPWEGALIEAPTLWKREGRYYLFYSANSYADERYAVGYAVAESVLGPYAKAGGPLLASDPAEAVIGPGGQDIAVSPDGETWLLYHTWDSPRAARRVFIDELDWQDGAPVVRGPDSAPQPAP